MRQVEPGVVVAPVAVVEVAGDEHEVDAAVERQIDHPLERPPRRAADPLDGRVLVLLQAPQRAVEVDIGGVEERDRHGGRVYSGSQCRNSAAHDRPIDQELLEPLRRRMSRSCPRTARTIKAAAPAVASTSASPRSGPRT